MMEGDIEPYTITVDRNSRLSYIELLPLACPRTTTTTTIIRHQQPITHQLCCITSGAGSMMSQQSIVSRFVSADSLDNSLSFVNQSGGRVQNPVLCSLEPSQNSFMLEKSPDSQIPSTSTIVDQATFPPVISTKKPRKKRQRKRQGLKAPQPPSSGYVIFCKQKRAQVQSEHPDLSFCEVTKILGKQWSQMNLTEKQLYQTLADTDKERYKTELKEFKTSDEYQRFMAQKPDERIDESCSKSDLYCDCCDQYFLNSFNKEQHLISQNHRNKLSENLNKFQRETRCCQCSCCEIEGSPDPLDMDSFIWSYYERSKERDFELGALRLRRQELINSIELNKHQLIQLENGREKLATDRLAEDQKRQILEQQKQNLKSLLDVFEPDFCD